MGVKLASVLLSDTYAYYTNKSPPGKEFWLFYNIYHVNVKIAEVFTSTFVTSVNSYLAPFNS